MNWISVETALPLPFKVVLIHTETCLYLGHLFVNWGSKIEWGKRITTQPYICWEVGYLIGHDRITHWMFPPAPPTKES